uniref:Uncharacterized protein n=1 Tax=Neobodo designis TaxID=312471 RepID=A0A7S1QTS0_NEODS
MPSMYAATAPTGAKPSPRRQPIVPPRKPVDLGALRAQLTASMPAKGGVRASEWEGISAERWLSVTFADIPTSTYDHLLQELLKGMLYETTVAAEQQIVKAAAATARLPRPDPTTQGRGVNFGEDEPTPLTAGPSGSVGGFATQSALGGAPTMYARLHRAYNTVMADFATTEAERDEARAALRGGGDGSSDTTPAATAPTTPQPEAQARASFSATVGQLCDRRVKQYERLLQAAREDAADLSAQLGDLRQAHEQVHADLNRSYREYDKVQKQLLAAIDRERKRDEEAAERARRNRALTERQDERWRTKTIGQLPGDTHDAAVAPGEDL